MAASSSTDAPPALRPAVERLPVHVYPPHLFSMFTSCKHLLRANASNATHNHRNNVELFWVRAVTQRSFRASTVPPHKARLFVVPVLCSRSAWGLCNSDHRSNLRQLRQTLKNSSWYRRRLGADHLLICEQGLTRPPGQRGPPGEVDAAGDVRRRLPQLLIGRFEPADDDNRTIGVGYSTFTDIGFCHEPNASVNLGKKPLPERAYDVSVAMQVKDKKSGAYNRRKALWCAYSRAAHRPAGLAVSTNQACNCTRARGGKEAVAAPERKVDKCESLARMGESRMVLSLAGDTPTTDRIFNAFDAGAVPLVLSNEVPAIVSKLPFGSVVPWQRLLLPLPGDDFDAAPLQALQGAATRASARGDELAARARLVGAHRRDVIWGAPGSRAHVHLLREALARVDGTVR